MITLKEALLILKLALIKWALELLLTISNKIDVVSKKLANKITDESIQLNQNSIIYISFSGIDEMICEIGHPKGSDTAFYECNISKLTDEVAKLNLLGFILRIVKSDESLMVLASDKGKEFTYFKILQVVDVGMYLEGVK